MPRDRSRSYPLITGVFLVCVFSLAILKTSDYDAWIHLTFGRLIWENHGLPVVEPFIPSMAGKPFSYSSWLFGVIYYGAYRLFDVYGIGLLKALSITTIFFVLLKDSLIPYRTRAVAILVLITVAVFIRPRFVERPDTFLMLFLSFSIFSLNAYLHDNKNYLYALPFVHLLWANSHSSINLMFIPFLAVFVGGWLGNVLLQKGIRTGTTLNGVQARFLALMFVASLACSVVSPYGISQFTFASQFLQLDVFKQEILELRPTTWMAGLKWFYILLGLTVVSFVAAGRRLSLADLARIVPFIYLGFLSRRFTYVFAIVAAPILIRNAAAALERLPEQSPRIRRAGHAFVVCWVVGWTVASFAQIGPLRAKGFSPGFGFNLVLQPESALAYMDQRNITGKIYNRFAWGQYIEWRDAPRRIPFVDGRGYLSPELIEQIVSEKNLDQLADRYGIDAFLLQYPKLSSGALESFTGWDLGLSLPGWVLVYWDDISLVYLKRGGKYDSVVQQDEYRVVKPANGIKAIEAIARDPQQREPLVRELQRNINATGSSRAYLLLGHAYLSMGNYRLAIETLQHVTNETFTGSASAGIARCYEQLGDTTQALKWFRASLKQAERSDSHYRIGLLLLNSGDASAAVRHLKRAVQLDATLYEAYPVLAAAYKKLGKQKEAAEVMKVTTGSQQGKEFFNAGVKAYMDGRLAEAAAAFEQAVAANPSHALSYANLGFALFDMGQADKAFASFQQALKVEPRCALAHYGVAMVYKLRGDNASAHEHWKQYLEIEPTGYFARMVKKELENKQ